MKIKFEINSKEFECDLSDHLEISIPMLFNGEQPNTYNVGKAFAKAYETGDFIGDTRLGGGCNFEEYKIVTHCNGTHTECVGHISFERISINETLKDFFIQSTLISVTPEKAFDTNENYIPQKNESDFLITKNILQEKLSEIDKDFLNGLIIRTLPNDDSKKSRDYMKNHAAIFFN